MKIDYLESGSPDCPLVRIYGTSIPEFKALHSVSRQLSVGSVDRVAVEALSGYESTDGTSLIFSRSGISEGFIQTGKKFELRITQAEWERIAYLIEPFLQRAGGYQWLWDTAKDRIFLLLSSTENGEW